MKIFDVLDRGYTHKGDTPSKKSLSGVVDLEKITSANASPKKNIGLSTKAAQELLHRNGKNELLNKKRTGALSIFAGQFRDLMIMILLIATAISALMGEVYDAITIVSIVFLNALLGFVQEYRTERTLQALKDMTAPSARVYRDGRLQSIPASELVVGDVIEIEAGDRVPADAALISCMGLSADEAILTGEAVPSSKVAATSQITHNKPNMSELIYMGTIITKGHGMAKVIATAMSTQMGLVSGMIAEIKPTQTPLQKRLDQLGRTLAFACIGICIIVAAIGALRGHELMDMLMMGISLAVAAIPEGLPATVTISLALAVRKFYKHHALIHKLHSVETLGNATVICSDKTGTLTENRMTVTRIYAGDEFISVTGSGYQIAGKFTKGKSEVSVIRNKILSKLLRAGVLCNNAKISSDNPVKSRNRNTQTVKGEWSVRGDPTEVALLVSAAKAGITMAGLEQDYSRTDEMPFDSKVRSMTVLVKKNSTTEQCYVKGAVDSVIENCGFILTHDGIVPLSAARKRAILQANEKMTSEALRVLAFAYKDMSGAFSHNERQTGLIFLGLQGMVDPPRAEVKKAVRTCKWAKVKTVMITGDHKNTACAIAKQVGILTGDMGVMTGSELEKLTDDQLDSRISNIAVFARVSPTDKLRIVKAFKRTGEIVAMTGDGVNDAPAVKEASIGVSMGITGTDVTKEASDIILLDDNFATLVKAIEQGRTVYENIRKSIRYMLSSNTGEVLTMLLGMIMGFPVVLVPIQILLVNLVTDGLPAIALGVEPPDEDIMRRTPRHPDEGIFANGMLFAIVIRGILIALATLGAFSTVLRLTQSIGMARTAAFLTLAFSQFFHVFECKHEKGTLLNVPYLNNIKLILAVLVSASILILVCCVGILQKVFAVVPPSTQALAYIAVCTLAVPVVSSIIGLFKLRK